METEKFLRILAFGGPKAIEQAIGELEPWLRRVIHVRLHGPRLRRLADTGDVFQSLIKDLMSRAASQSSANGDRSLLKPYLLGAVRNKIRARLRKERRHAGSLDGYPEPISAERDAPLAFGEQEYLLAVRLRLTAKDQWVFEMRREGHSWAEIAQSVGGQPDALRVRFRRSLAAAILELGD